jgi:cardiolipin synthase
MAGWMATVVVLLDLGIKVIALGVVPENRRPSSSGMGWLLLILMVPFLGFVIFRVLGRTRLERRRHQHQAEFNAIVATRTEEHVPARDIGITRPAYVDAVATLNRNLGAQAVMPGNRVDLFAGYAEPLAAMTAEVDRASAWVHVEFYITACDQATGPFYEALGRAVQRGVKVRLLFDHLGSRAIPGYRAFKARLDAIGIEWHPMLPIQPHKGAWRRPDLRNHRKILVVDGRVAFTGSQNLIEPGYHKAKHHRVGREWVELMARVEGPAASALNLLFASDWYSETEVKLSEEIGTTPAAVGGIEGQVIASGPGFATENNLRAFTSLLYSARRRLSIITPYFVPDDSLLYAITTAAHRGVEVELFVNETGDQFMAHHAQRSYYEALLQAGVRIHVYPAPAILHSKCLTVDDEVAVLGSSNMDMRSFGLNYEVSLMLLGPGVVAELRKVEDTYRVMSRELTLESWLVRPRRSAYVDNVMRLTAAWQ